MKENLVKFIIILSILNITLCADKYKKLWEKYKKKFGKKYDDDEEHRRQVWENNVKGIIKHNQGHGKGLHHYKQFLNEMTDMSDDEYAAHAACGKTDDSHKKLQLFKPDCDNECLKNLPKRVDWRKKHVVAPIKSQGHCGSCWAFATVAALESHYAIKHGKLVTLSEQELVDCTKEYGNEGCKGGNPVHAFAYVMRKKGINKDKKYPYKHMEKKCKKIKDKKFGNLKKIVMMPINNETAMKVAVARHGPVLARVHATSNFHKYKTGIFHDKQCSQTSEHKHDVLVIGYGELKGVPYWLIKNSWSKRWGRKGYMNLMRDTNECGVGERAFMPIM